MEKKRLNVTISGASESGPGEAILADAVYENDRVIVYNLEGEELARADVKPGDDPWAVARMILPRRRPDSFWRPLPVRRWTPV